MALLNTTTISTANPVATASSASTAASVATADRPRPRAQLVTLTIISLVACCLTVLALHPVPAAATASRPTQSASLVAGPTEISAGPSPARLPTDLQCSEGLFGTLRAEGTYLSVTLTKLGRFTTRFAPGYVAARLASCYGTIPGGSEADVWSWLPDLSAELWLHAVAYAESCAQFSDRATCDNLRARANPVDINFHSYATLPAPDRYLR